MIQLTVMDNPWLPDAVKDGLTPKQAEFLAYEGREALFGGAAGGGKSVALLAAALQYAECPGYSALILRRTHAQLAKADSILAKAKEWLKGAKDPRGRLAKYNGTEHKFTFPSGATLEFGHMAHEDAKLNYQGGSWAYIGVDEATQFTGDMLSYPRTRQRRVAGSAVPVRWRGASNPGGIGHAYVKDRYVEDANGGSPCSAQRQYFPATIEDNPHIDREDYVAQLKESGVDPVTLAQLLAGDWRAYIGGRFWRAWFDARYSWRGDYLCRPGKPVVERKSLILFGTCDSAASIKDDADPTVACVWAVTPDCDLLWLDMVRQRLEVPDIVPMLRTLQGRHGLGYWAIEGGGTQKGVAQLAARSGLVVKEMIPRGDKLVRATPAIVACESGRVYLPQAAPWLADALGELTLFTGDEKKDAHDDIVDNLSYAVMRLDRREDEQKTGFAPRGVHQR